MFFFIKSVQLEREREREIDIVFVWLSFIMNKKKEYMSPYYFLVYIQYEFM